MSARAAIWQRHGIMLGEARVAWAPDGDMDMEWDAEPPEGETGSADHRHELRAGPTTHIQVRPTPISPCRGTPVQRWSDAHRTVACKRRYYSLIRSKRRLPRGNYLLERDRTPFFATDVVLQERSMR